jgi:hypothetical protein
MTSAVWLTTTESQPERDTIMQIQLRVLGVAAAVMGLLTMSACSGQNESKETTISQTQIAGMKQVQKLPGASVAGDLDYIVNWGKDAEDQSQRILGRVVDVLAPKTGSLGDSGFELLWVPVLIDVVQSDPQIQDSRMVVRVIPKNEFSQDLEEINIGDIVLTVGTSINLDPAGERGSSLGWMLEVDEDGSLRDLNTSNVIAGNFNDVADLLRMEPLN